MTELEIFSELIYVLIEEILQLGNISHLFTDEEKNSVINSIRTSGDQEKAQLTSLETWNYFIEYVHCSMILCIPLAPSLFVIGFFCGNLLFPLQKVIRQQEIKKTILFSPLLLPASHKHRDNSLHQVPSPLFSLSKSLFGTDVRHCCDIFHCL